MKDGIVNFSSAKPLPITDFWEYEEHEFTPWMCEHINEIGEVIGIDLEVINREVHVGSFELDILAKDIVTDNYVVIENQFGSSDHKHLGQCHTYGAGFGANTIVWIAESFRDEHIKAVNFFNDITTNDYSFFAIEIKCYDFNGVSVYKFNKVAGPTYSTKQFNAAKSGRKETSIDNSETLAFLNTVKDAMTPNYSVWVQSDPTRSPYARVNTRLLKNLNIFLGYSKTTGKFTIDVETQENEEFNNKVVELLKTLDMDFTENKASKNWHNKFTYDFDIINSPEICDKARETLVNALIKVYNCVLDTDLINYSSKNRT